MRVELDAVVAAAKDAEATKEVVQVVEESESAKASEIEAAVWEAIRCYRSSEEFTVLLDSEVGSEMADSSIALNGTTPGRS